jgi:hypothetical protein
LVSGLVTAMVMVDQSQRIVSVAQRIRKLASYSIDGMVADIFSRPPGELPAWERDGLTVQAIAALHANAASRANTAHEIQPAIELSTVSTLSLDKCEELLFDTRTKLAATSVQNSRRENLDALQNALVARHQKLLIVAISEARSQELLARTGLGSELLPALIEKKRQLKERCRLVHGEKLGRIFATHLRTTVNQLTALRIAQLELADQLRVSSAGDQLVIRQRLREMDVEKHQLKKEAKTLFRVDIASKSERVTPWKHRLHRQQY